MIAGSHYRQLSLHLKGGAIAYTNPKRPEDTRLYKVKEMKMLKQISEKVTFFIFLATF